MTSDPLDLDDLLDDINVQMVDEYHNEVNNNGLEQLIGWYMISDGNGVFAYASTERKALEIRLAEINNRLNVLPSYIKH